MILREPSGLASDRFADLGNRMRSLLNVILGHAQLFGMNDSLGEEGLSQIREIELAARELTALAEQLPSLARGELQARPKPVDSMSGARTTAHRVLVVEDHPVNQEVLRRQLETLGCDVDIVGNGLDALAIWQKGGYGLILADLNMPGMSGIELAQAVRAREQTSGSRTPIIAVTAATVSDKCDICKAADMDGMLAKPVDLRALRETLRRWRIGNSMSASISEASEPKTKLTRLFLSVAREDLAEGRRLLRERKSEGLVEIMHKLKSSSLNVGAMRFSKLATELERSARISLWHEVERQFNPLEKALADFEADSAQTALGRATGVSDGSISPEDIRLAIQHDEFDVHFRPSVDAASLQPVGAEALACWYSDRHGWVPSKAFIALAERHGLIGPLSELLLTKALIGGARLHELGYSLTLTVNLPISWIAQPQFPGFILATLKAAGMPAKKVLLEISQADAKNAKPAALAGLARLRQLGLGLAIEGINPKDLSEDWLRSLGCERLKLGGAYLKASAADHPPKLLALADSQGIGIMADGVDAPEDLQWARRLNCGMVQGCLIAGAMPFEDLIRWLKLHSKNPGLAP